MVGETRSTLGARPRNDTTREREYGDCATRRAPASACARAEAPTGPADRTGVRTWGSRCPRWRFH